MKKLLMVMILTAVSAGSALAGSGYDECIREEKALKARETDSCTGMSYLFNPSACFANRKLLKEYKAGKCRQIGLAEGVAVDAAPPAAVQRVVPPAPTPAAAPVAVPAAPTARTGAVAAERVAARPQAVEPPRQELTPEQLRQENARLREENSRLKLEIQQLRSAGR